MKRDLLTSLSLTAVMAGFALAGSAPALAASAPLPDQAELGRDSAGDPCLASRFWQDPGATDPFAVSYSMTCRGATASRHLGIARRVTANELAPINAFVDCGAAMDVTVPGLGMMHVRRCFDKMLGLETVESRVALGKHELIVSAVPNAQGPAEEALRLLAGIRIDVTNRGRTIAPVVDVSRLGPAPTAPRNYTVSSDTNTALEQGLHLIHAGLYMEASRVLNDTLSRLPADAPVDTRIELLLVSGLADSNLGFFDSAGDYFRRADDLLRANPGIQGAGVLQHKRNTYGALDDLNRRKFGDAVTALNQLSTPETEHGQPLLNPTLVRTLNQPDQSRRDTVEGMMSTPDFASLSQLIIDAQAAWATSVALLAQNRLPESASALSIADRNFIVLSAEKVDRRQVRWLEARIERQRARLLLRGGDRNGAMAALDKAIGALRMAQANGATGPALAETQLERAGVLARGSGNPAVLLANFDDAVNTLISSDSQGTVLPPAIEQYLDLLVADANAHPDGQSAERYFRALQAVGDPAIARQFVQLQSLVTADPKLAAKVHDQQDLVREITRLRFAIDSAAPGDTRTIAQLNDQRGKLEGELVALQAQLQGNKAYGAVNDAPVTLAELRKVLRPDEAYFKLTKVRNYIFGMLIDGNGTLIYRVKNPDIEIEPLADVVRASIDGGGDKLPHYNVGAAYALFDLLTGSAAERLVAAKSLIVDANGPLQKLPIGVLVANKVSVTRYAAVRDTTPYDYTMVDFIARRQSISTALSPRSLLVSRHLAPSNAPLPFIGFAQHEPAPMTIAGGDQMISVGTGCEAERKTIGMLTRELKPIDARELDRASEALGIGKPRELIGAAFTDTAVKQMTDLDQFQVLHFATHGLTEGQWGCSKSPPALVTSLGGPESDAILSFDEIAHLRLDANLVVLSACDTASGISTGQARSTGQEEAGATLEGLVRAFLAANARAVLSTYWPISDAGESEDLIADFYRAARTGTIGDALRSAQSTIMANPKSSHPLYWGAFFVVGDAQKPLLTPKAKTALSLALPGAAAIVHGR